MWGDVTQGVEAGGGQRLLFVTGALYFGQASSALRGRTSSGVKMTFSRIDPFMNCFMIVLKGAVVKVSQLWLWVVSKESLDRLVPILPI